MTVVNYGRPYPPDGNGFEAIALAPAGNAFVHAVGDTPEQTADQFAALWAQQPGVDLNNDPLEFQLGVRVRAELAFVLNVGWRIRGNPGDGTTVEVTGDDRTTAETEFIGAWNAARGTEFEPDEFAFDRAG